MASGLLVAGIGASLALAEPETGQGGSTSSPHENGSTGTKEPTTGAPASGAVATGGAATGSSGDAGAESKPTSQVGDGRSGLLAGHPTGTPVLGGATDPTSKQTQHASGAPSQSGEAVPSEQTPGATSPVAGEPRSTAVMDVPPAVEPPVEGESRLPNAVPRAVTNGVRKSGDRPRDPAEPRDRQAPAGASTAPPSERSFAGEVPEDVRAETGLVAAGREALRAGHLAAATGLLEQARSYAMANHTYVWVGFEEVDASKNPSVNPQTIGTGRIAIAIVASRDGTRGYDITNNSLPNPAWTNYNNGVNLVPIDKLVRFENVHMAPFFSTIPNSGNTARPANPATGRHRSAVSR